MKHRRLFAQVFTLLTSLVLAGCAGLNMPVAPKAGVNEVGQDGTWRVARARLYLSPRSAGTDQAFRFSGIGATRSEIAFDFVDAVSARGELTCDGAFKVTGPGIARGTSDGVPVRFDLVRRNDSGETGIVLTPDRAVRTCNLMVAYSSSTRHYRIEREEISSPLLAHLDVAHKDCKAQNVSDADPLKAAFLATGGLSMTCSMPAGTPDLLEGAEESFNARVKALLGQTLPDAFIRAGNPYAPIDFSRAPKLKLIVLSVLDFKADFSGTVIARLVRHHAERGTPVRIMASTILERHKDQIQLKRLAADFPNVSLMFYRYEPSSLLVGDELLAAVHRVHHIKLFAAIGEEPDQSAAILGGRNIHDGFLYRKPLDLRAWPHLYTYPGRGALTLNYYTNWHDFDLAFHDDAVVRRLIAHFGWIWTADTRSHAYRPLQQQMQRNLPPMPMRHFISVPYKDGHALEQFYVRLIDAARHKIEIVNPYLNLTLPLQQAFDRAISRGVKVEIIGRIDMRGDLGGEVLTAVNEKFVRENFGRMTIRDYKPPEVVLHAKILMIDGMLSVVSSVNLNNRSFLHDTENGVVIYGKAFHERMESVFDRYRRDSNPVTKPGGWTAYQLLLLNPVIKQTF